MADGLSLVSSLCVTCDTSCKKCTGKAASQCTACYSGKYLLAANSSCVPCNTDNYGPLGTDCVNCDTSCLTCSVGASPTSCTSCPSGTYLLLSNNSCVSCNVDGYFISSDECLQCDSECLTCNGVSPTSCLSCPSGTYLLPSNMSCAACNVDGYFISGTECLQCDPTCLTCNGAMSTNCITCVTSKYFVSSNNSCISCDVSGYFISGTECLQCDPTCLTCNGTSSTSCFSCKPGNYLQNSTCIKDDLKNKFISAGKLAGIIMQAQTVATSVLPAVTGGLSTSAVLLVGFLADVDIYKYINVDFPQNFVDFCQQIGAASLPNIFQRLDTVNEGNNPSSTIEKFQFWGLSATLLDNSSTAIFKEFVTLGIILGLNILMLSFKAYPRFHGLLNKARRLFMWNLFLSYFLGDFSELLLNSMVQLRENYVSSAYANLSFAFAVLIVIAYPLLLGYLIFLVNKTPPKQLKPTKSDVLGTPTTRKQVILKWGEVPHSIGILVEDFRSNSSFTRNFMFIMLLESFLQILVVFFLQQNGVTQALLYTIIVIVFVTLCAWHRPYKSKLQMALLLLNLISKAVMGIMAIIFGLNDILRFISQLLFDLMGATLGLLILVVIGTNFLISIMIMIISIYEWVKEWRKRSKMRRPNPQGENTKSKKINPRNTFVTEQNLAQTEEISQNIHSRPPVRLFQQQPTDSPRKRSQARNIQTSDSPGPRIIPRKNRLSNRHRNYPQRKLANRQIELNSHSLINISGVVETKTMSNAT